MRIVRGGVANENVKVKMMVMNYCVVGYCGVHTTPEGFMCAKHWNMLSGKDHAQYTAFHVQALHKIHAKEQMR